MNDYDRVPYRSEPYPHAHPDHLAAAATLFGLEPVPIEGARVLEIGCSAGGHLLPIAASLPGATFVGVDPAGSAVALGRARVAELGLHNVELLAVGVEALPEGEPFDYVVAHGVLSWIPPGARAALWKAVGTRLSDRGVAYLSWNAYPGWSLRGGLCGMLRWHTREVDDPMAKVAAARALLALLCETTPATSEWGAMLGAERRRVDALDDWYLFHDHLAEHNTPFWFHEVDAAARAHGLRWLAEAELWRMDADPAGSLAALAETREELEQYRDFARMAAFRETLWVRDTAVPALRPDRLRALSFTMRARPLAEVRPADPEPARFRTREGTVVTAHDPLAKALLLALGDGQRAWSFGELCARAEATLASDRPRSSASEPDFRGTGVASATLASDRPRSSASEPDFRGTGGASTTLGPIDREAAAANLLALVFGHGILRLHRWPRVWLAALTERPVVFATARAQARAGDARVTNLGHEGVPVDAFDRAVLSRLDGAHDRERLTAALVAAVRGGALAVDTTREPLRADPLTAAVERRLLETLLRVARSALLVG